MTITPRLVKFVPFLRSGLMVHRNSWTKAPARYFHWRYTNPFYDFSCGFNKLEKGILDFDRNFEHFMRQFPRMRLSNVQEIENKDGIHRVRIMVGDFKPGDIKVSVKAGVVKICAKSDNIDENGFKTHREFQKEFKLPEDIKSGSMKSYLDLNTDMLTIEGEFNEPEKQEPERVDIPVE